MLRFPKIGDSGMQIDSDWRLSGESIVLIEKLKELPTLNEKVSIANQYTYERHNDSCTKFAPYNVRCTMFDREVSYEEIDEIEKISLEMGREGPGHGRSSTQGFDAVRKYVNANHKEQGVSKRSFNLYSDVFDILCEKKIPMGISIVVDSVYWKDVKDGVLNGTSFKKNYGHADVIVRNHKDSNYRMLESVGGTQYEIEESKLKALVDLGNVRSYGYVFLPLNKFNMPELVSNLPEHITAEQTKDPAEKDIIVAWEIEASNHVNSGGKLKYNSYTGKLGITRMLIDLAFIRD